ncbi:MAG TPA: hypothetical protein VE201_05465 [Nitrospirales bacterium]|nr:hypothetical protein [Nitrospirales bacterium]
MKSSMSALLGTVVLAAGVMIVDGLWCEPPTVAEQKQPKLPLAQQYPIVIDATGIVPPRAWSVPGVTEPLQSVRDRMMTDKVATLKLRPGRYMFMTTAFSFEFMVNLDGKLDYLKLLDKCVGGRGTATLVVKCRISQQIVQ